MVLSLASAAATAQSIIPMPESMIRGNGSLDLSKITHISTSSDSLRNETQFLGALTKSPVSSRKGGIPLSMIIDKSMTCDQAYRLRVDSKGIILTAATRQGLFYAISTLSQIATDRSVDYITIEDSPRFEYRALMLDPARHFLPVEDIKKYLDAMSRYKFTALHLHLSDDQGWRVEILKYPLLTQIGSIRTETEGDGREHRGYYTQRELKDLVDYASKRHIEIIPEIDVPGHSVSAIAAYPELTCRDTLLGVRTTIGVSTDLLCAGNERVFEMYDDIFQEICDIFPSKKIHIGGDEAPLTNWATCERCQAMKSANILSTNQQLMSEFFRRINLTLERNSRTPLIWYEVDVPNYPKNSIMFAWRYGLSPQVIGECRDKGYKVICAPGEHAYLDYPEAKSDITDESSAWIPALPMEKVYDFDPAQGLTPEQSNHILGVEATIWGEYVPDIATAFARTYPRALAIAEAGWSRMEHRKWYDFRKRAYKEVQHLKKQGINYRLPDEKPKLQCTKECSDCSTCELLN